MSADCSQRNLLLRFRGAPPEHSAFILSLSGPLMTDITPAFSHMSVSHRLLAQSIRLFKIGGLTKWEFPNLWRKHVCWQVWALGTALRCKCYHGASFSLRSSVGWAGRKQEGAPGPELNHLGNSRCCFWALCSCVFNLTCWLPDTLDGFAAHLRNACSSCLHGGVYVSKPTGNICTLKWSDRNPCDHPETFLRLSQHSDGGEGIHPTNQPRCMRHCHGPCVDLGSLRVPRS